MTPKMLVFAPTAIVLLALDQATKWWVRGHIALRGDLPVIPNFLSISHAKNKGAAFSALDDFEYRLWVFYAFTAVAVYVLVQGFRQLRSDDRLQAFAMGSILSGAVGNFIDRVTAGEVTDMIKVFAGSEPLRGWAIAHIGTNVYPIFNVADAAIVVGVGLFAVSYFLEKEPAPEGAAPAGGAASTSTAE
ncbi:lipoprotein signal peptidase [Deltaproteobacteria bacterium]|nr:lipoprotein signal peptidase [Deltaproteobacteria bacterium]